jgi:hypothetical protein
MIAGIINNGRKYLYHVQEERAGIINNGRNDIMDITMDRCNNK